MVAYKNIYYQIHVKVIHVLSDMYFNIKGRIKVGNLLYSWIKDGSGTNQGVALSPNMFRKLLCNTHSFFDTQHSIVINEQEILVDMLWADDRVLIVMWQVCKVI